MHQGQRVQDLVEEVLSEKEGKLLLARQA